MMRGFSLVLLLLCPLPVLGLNQGDGWKILVITSTTIAALIFFGIIACIFWYVCVRKWVANAQHRDPAAPRGHRATYQIGGGMKPPMPPQDKDYQRYESNPPPRSNVNYQVDNDRMVGMYEKEPGSRPVSLHDHSVLTSSSYGSGGVGGAGGGPVVVNPQGFTTSQQGPFNTSYTSQNQSYTVRESATRVSAAYTGSSV